MKITLDMIIAYNYECGKLLFFGRYEEAAEITDHIRKAIKEDRITEDALEYWHNQFVDERMYHKYNFI